MYKNDMILKFIVNYFVTSTFSINIMTKI